MNLFIHRALGHFLMNEAGTEGGEGGGAAATGTEGQQQSQPSGSDTLLGGQQDQQDQQPPGDKSTQQPGEQASSEDQAAKPVVPEQYAFENLPEGYSLDEAATTEWSAVFKDAGFTQEQVDKLIAMDAKRQAGIAEAQQQQMLQQRQQQLGDWVNELKADAEFGGAKFEANVATAQKALGEFGSPELSKVLAQSGMGSHPEVVRLFHRIGQQLAEGQLSRSGAGPAKEISIVDAFR